MNPLALSQVFTHKLMIDGLCCNFQPCDAVDVLEPATQEEDDSTHTLLKSCNNGTYYSLQHL